jgi:hypothetical protein
VKEADAEPDRVRKRRMRGGGGGECKRGRWRRWWVLLKGDNIDFPSWFDPADLWRLNPKSYTSADHNSSKHTVSV